MYLTNAHTFYYVKRSLLSVLSLENLELKIFARNDVHSSIHSCVYRVLFVEPAELSGNITEVWLQFSPIPLTTVTTPNLELSTSCTVNPTTRHFACIECTDLAMEEL